MQKRKIMLLMAAAIVAIGTVFVARSLLGPQEQAQVAVPVVTTEVLAAARDLPTGTILKEMDMKWIPWSAEAETSKLYIKGKSDMATLVGAVLRDGLRTDEPLLIGRVVQPRDHGFLAAVLVPGRRAMTVSLTPSTGVAGFIFPGDHVDVILTHSFSRKDSNDLVERRVSETVLSDVRVLALDQRSDNQSTEVKVATLATLEVTPEQSQKLALAADMVSGQGHTGSLSLVLRSLAMQEPMADGTMGPAATPEATRTTWDSDVSPAYPTVNGEDGLMQRVHVMRGEASTEHTFERHR